MENITAMTTNDQPEAEIQEETPIIDIVSPSDNTTPDVPAEPAEKKVGQDKKTTKTRDEVTIKRQILTNARKYLTELADKQFKETGEYVAPTEAKIKEECKKRWQQHLDRTKDKVDVSAYFD